MDIMLDLETLGSKPGSVIVAIGATVMDLTRPYVASTDSFYSVVDPQSCVDTGMTIEAGTVLWWMKQSESARGAIAGERVERKHINKALLDFSAWIKHQHSMDTRHPGTPVRVWGNGATFDNVLLRIAYEKTCLQAPWSYRDDMCYRTMKNLFPEAAAGVAANTGAHHALADATFQAEVLHAIFEAVRNGAKPHHAV